MQVNLWQTTQHHIPENTTSLVTAIRPSELKFSSKLSDSPFVLWPFSQATASPTPKSDAPSSPEINFSSFSHDIPMPPTLLSDAALTVVHRTR
jgi:hypothetical protein